MHQGKVIRHQHPGQIIKPQRHWISVDIVHMGSTAMLPPVLALFSIGAWVSDGFTDRRITGVRSDFSVFWGVSYIALHDDMLQAYGLNRVMTVIHQFDTLASGNNRLLPWPYPLTFLLVMLPLALLLFWPSYLVFMLTTGLFYMKTTLGLLGNRVMPRHRAWVTIVGSPAVFVTVLMGQNSMLTAGLATMAVTWQDKRPVLAGVAIDLLVIKPQLAMLLPIALLASRAWRALASATATVLGFAGVSIAVCGWKIVPAFLESVRWAQENMIDDGGVSWYMMPTFLAAARAAGLGVSATHTIQMTTAIIAVGALVCVWCRISDNGLRIAMLATAAMLTSPYLRAYELTWLLVAVAGVVSHGTRFGLSGGKRFVLVLARLLPLFEFVNPLCKLPQIGPLVFITMAVLVVRRVTMYAEHGATLTSPLQTNLRARVTQLAKPNQ